MYKTDKTKKLIELNSFLPNLTKVEFKEIYNRSYIGSPRSNLISAKPDTNALLSPRVGKSKNHSKLQTINMEKSYSRKN